MTDNEKRPRQEDAEGANMENGIREPQCKGTENQRDIQGLPKKIDVFAELISIAEPNPIFGAKLKDDELAVLICRNLQELCETNELHLVSTDLGLLQYTGYQWELIDERSAKYQLSRLLAKLGVPPTKAEYHRFCKDVCDQLGISFYGVWKNRGLSNVRCNLLNGTYDMETMQLLSHDPDDHFLYTLPFVFDDKAVCPIFDNFLAEVVPELQSRFILQEYCAYVLLRNLQLEKALFLDLWVKMEADFYSYILPNGFL